MRKRFAYALLVLLAAALAAPVFAATPMVAAGGQHTLALQSDGTVVAWGSNANGQLGNGQTIFTPTPAMVPGLSSVKAISAGSLFILAAKQDGTVWSWGSNRTGQLGDGTTTDQSSPVQAKGVTGAIAVAGGGDFSLALKSDGTVWAWGYNDIGELGMGQPTQNTASNVPPALIPGLSGVTAIAAGFDHALALKSDGTVWAWGENSHGSVGDGSTSTRYTPVQVLGLAGVVGIAAGAGRSFAVKSDGSVWEWGLGFNAANAPITRLTPVQTQGITGVVAISAEADTVFVTAVRSDGSAWQWGAGQAPGAIPNAASGVIAATGDTATLLLTISHTLKAYGFNTNGEVGDGTTIQRGLPVAIVSLSNVTAVAAGQFYSAALTGDGSVWTWGSDSNGQLGYAAIVNFPVPVTVQNLAGATQVAAGQSFSLALKSDGTVWAWGSNLAGQLGDGTNINRSTPVQVAGLSNVVSIAAGQVASFAVKSDGTLWAWGDSQYGELGFTPTRSGPAQVPGLTGVTAVAANNQTLALKQDGTVWAWGQNQYGQLGRGTTDPFRSTGPNQVPTQVPGLPAIRAIAASRFDSYAVATDGSVWAWGLGGTSQFGEPGAIGDGTSSSQYSPVKLSGISNATAISGQYGNAFALLADGSVWGWGVDYYGQLGGLASVIAASPVQISGYASITQLSAGGSSVALLKQDGTVNMAGDNSIGELGNGTLAQSTKPVLAVNTTGSGYLDLFVGQTPLVSSAQAVPFFVASNGGIANNSATVSTIVKYNAADQGKSGSVYITAIVPAGSSLTHAGATAYKSPLQGATSTQTIQLTPSGWQPVVNGQLIPFASGVLGATSSALQILNNTDTSTLPGAQFCVGYSTTGSVTSRTVATIPAATTTGISTTTATCATAVTAIVPQPGYWWNPTEGGRGYTIEQNATTGNVFFAMYLYNANGNSVWYAAGPGQMSGNTFTGPLLAFAGGQTLTGAFKAASAGTSPGTVTIAFSDTQNATLSLPGGTMAITRYPIVTGGTNLTPSATQPQSGYWWNPAEGGRGYTIEVQNNTAFIAAYMYDTSGNPVWYAAGPATLTGNNTFQGNWTSYTGGQTLTGPYQSPSGTSNAGNLTLQFATPTTGTLTLPDSRQIPIQRFAF